MAKAELVMARELIRAGWTKGEPFGEINNKPCYCLTGAVAAANGLDVDVGEIYINMGLDVGTMEDLFLLIKFMPQRYEGPGTPIVQLFSFNDSQNSVDPVLELFDKAIAWHDNPVPFVDKFK